MQAFAGTQQAHHRWPPWHGGEHTQASHQPHVLQVTILLREGRTQDQRAVRNTCQIYPQSPGFSDTVTFPPTSPCHPPFNTIP